MAIEAPARNKAAPDAGLPNLFAHAKCTCPRIGRDIGSLAFIKQVLDEMQISKVGVIGAGQMGNGIAHVCALAGYDVALNDISPERIEAGLATINGNLARRVKSGKSSEAERDAALARIRAAPLL